jgi:hypothetical protein
MLSSTHNLVAIRLTRLLLVDNDVVCVICLRYFSAPHDHFSPFSVIGATVTACSLNAGRFPLRICG